MSKYRKQAGFTVIEIVIAIAILAILLSLVVANTGNLADSGKKNPAIIQITSFVGSIVEYGSLEGGDYTNIDVQELVDTGSTLAGEFTDGLGENVFNLDVVVAPTNANADALLSYSTGDAGLCAKLIQSAANLSGVKDGADAPTCVGTVATFTVD